MNNHELYHYGVKGMKWGVRKDREKGTISRARPRPDSVMETREMLAHKPKKKTSVRIAKNWILNNNHLMDMQVRQANQFAMDAANRASINAALQSASLSMSGGMNPFMFGMM